MGAQLEGRLSLLVEMLVESLLITVADGCYTGVFNAEGLVIRFANAR